MANKLIECKACGAEMAASAKTCPKCGAKNRKPIYKRWWLWVLVVIVVISLVSGGGNSSSDDDAKNSAVQAGTAPRAEQKAEVINYAHYDVTELFDALDANALKAQSTFKGQYVEIEGFLGTIDSDGKYIGIGAVSSDYDYLFQSVHCDLKNDTQRQQIMEMGTDDPIVVRGKITDVGEVLGYYLDIDSIN